MGWKLKANLRGPSVELREAGGYVQWRVAGSGSAWVNLLPLTDIQGLPGVNGVENVEAVAGYVDAVTPNVLQDALSAAYVTKVRPLGGGADDAPRINAALNAASTWGARKTVVLEGDFSIGSYLRVPDRTTIDARAATVTAMADCGYLLQTTAMDGMLLAPRECTATPSTTGGTLGAGLHVYRVSCVTTVGQTIASLEFSATTTGTTGSVALKWRTPRVGPYVTITQYKIWRGGASGAVDTLVATVAAVNPAFDQDVFWTDIGAAGSAGSFPVMNTTFARTSAVAIIGGVWDSNRTINAGSGEGWQASRFIGHGFNLQKVDGLLIRDVKVQNASKWGIAVSDFTNLVTENLSFDTNSDGIHVLGPGAGWRGRGFYGHTGDDMVGMSLVEWPNQTVSEGDITGVDLSDFRGVDAPSAARMLLGTGHKFDKITVGGVRGEYTQYRDGTTGAYTNPAVGVVFLNADNNNPGRRGGTFESVTFENLVPDAHQSDVLQVDGIGTALNVRNVRSVQSARFAVRVGATVYDVGRPTWIQTAVIDDAVASHENAARAVYVANANTTVNDLIINRPKVVLTNAGNSMPVTVIDATVNRLKVHDPIFRNVSANPFSVVECNNALVDDILITGAQAERANVVLYLNGGIYGTANIRGGVVSNGQAVVKSKQPVSVTVTDLKATTLSDGVLTLYTSAATPVVFQTAGLTLSGAAGLARDGSQVVTARSLTTECDVSKLAKTANTMAYNTNAALGCGIGPVVCNGTSWKHLFSGATY